jgi:O-antigen/teichoic acid export membrane protein
MEHVDPYKVVRNTATLQAYRDRLKAARRAGQPFLWIWVAAILLNLLIEIPALLGGGFKGAGLAISLLLIVGGVSGLIAALRIRRYLRRHPSAV